MNRIRLYREGGDQNEVEMGSSQTAIKLWKARSETEACLQEFLREVETCLEEGTPGCPKARRVAERLFTKVLALGSRPIRLKAFGLCLALERGRVREARRDCLALGQALDRYFRDLARREQVPFLPPKAMAHRPSA